MNTLNDNNYHITTSEYDRSFWNIMRGRETVNDTVSKGMDKSTGGLALPSVVEDKCIKATTEKSVFRNIATVIKAYRGASRIYAKDSNDLATFVPENGTMPIYDATDDFTRHTVDRHKLAVFIKMDEDFVYDAAFSIEDCLVDRLAQNFSRAEDNSFVNGTGIDMPTGILDKNNGTKVGVTTAKLTFDDVISLYYSLDKKYRKNAVWLMNDETALALRFMKDDNGNYLWNSSDNTILGKPVVISYDMPDAANGNVPIVFGDFSYYWIILRSPISVRTLKEKFITLNQIGYLAIEFLDGKLIRRDAVKALEVAE